MPLDGKKPEAIYFENMPQDKDRSMATGLPAGSLAPGSKGGSDPEDKPLSQGSTYQTGVPVWTTAIVSMNNQQTDRDKLLHHLRTEVAALTQRLGLDPQNHLVVALQNQVDVLESHAGDNRRTQIFRRAAIDINPDENKREFASLPPITLKQAGEALVAVSSRLDHKYAEIRALIEITERVNSGMFFDEVLDHVFESFEKILPFDRISVALIEKRKRGQKLLRWAWVRAKYEPLHLHKGYTVRLSDTGLNISGDFKAPRIINNLAKYLEEYPKSQSTQMTFDEGIRSSLTCPLVTKGELTGFIFFSSRQPDVYLNRHVDFFSQIAGELALTLEKSRAYEDLYLRNELIKKVFGRYVTNEIAEAVLSSKNPLSLEGERRKVTVLMADLRDFTPMSEVLSPEKIVKVLNIFLGAMADVVMNHGGNVDNFIGDSIMAVFGVPIANPDDSARAVACALDMQKRLSSINGEIKKKGLPELKMGIGLSTGEVIAGNVGSDQRLKYSVIGSTVNLAARIQSITSGGQVFASEATFKEVHRIVRTDGNLSVTEPADK